MQNLIEETLKEKVFATLRNLVILVKDVPDLNAERDQLLCSLENALSWEAWLEDGAPCDQRPDCATGRVECPVPLRCTQVK